MKQPFAPRKARSLAPFLVATALVATPAFAQDAAPQTAPAQPAIVTPPQSATVTIPPVVRTVPDTPPEAAAPASTPAPRTAARTAAPRTIARSQPVRSQPAPRAAAAPAAAAPIAAAPASQPATPAASVNTAPVAPAAVPASQPAPAPAADTTSAQSTTTNAVPVWAWIAGGLAALTILLIGLFAARRRRADVYDDPADIVTVIEEPAEPAVAAPVAKAAAKPRKAAAKPAPKARRAPVGKVESVVAAADDVEVTEPEATEVAELTAGDAPVAERPWLEFAMRPVRAGTNVDEALVEIELTVGNSGSVSARDVRISTFLLSADPKGSEMERLLVAPPADATTDPVTIEPGEGKRIDATLALLKSDMGENLPASFRPIVVADARYTLADGSEGRTSASFEIGVTPEEGDGLEPIELSRSSMHDNVGAELHGQPQHA